MLAGELLAEAVEILLGQATHREGAGVDAGGGVALEEHVVAAAGVVPAAEEVIEPDLVHRRDRRVGGEVAADGDAGALGAMDDHRRVPAVDVAQLLLELHVTGVLRLVLLGDRVHVVRGQRVREVQVLVAGMLDEALHDLGGPIGAAVLDEPVERVEPLPGLLRVGILRMARQVDADGTRGLVRSHTVLLSTGVDGPAVGAEERRWARLLWPRCRPDYRRPRPRVPSRSLLICDSRDIRAGRRTEVLRPECTPVARGIDSARAAPAFATPRGRRARCISTDTTSRGVLTCHRRPTPLRPAPSPRR